VDLDRVREAVEALVQAGPPGTELPEKVLPTPRARRALDAAREAARELGHAYVGTEHLLLGLLNEGQGVAARALRSLGVEPEGVRAEMLAVLGMAESASETPGEADEEEAAEAPAGPLPQREVPWPEWVREAVNAPAIIAAERQVAETRAAKEAAVKDQDFEAAARKRDEERALRSALPQQASLRALRALLDRPDDPACAVLLEMGLDLQKAKERLDAALEKGVEPK
jgi:hypothetical protein